jgi:hypothetical protein
LNLSNPKWDAFICHASEDKDEVARPLAENLRNRGFRIWYDEFILHVGDSLMEKIDFGLKNSDFGIVILSKNFFQKSWTKNELNGLNSKAMIGNRKVILPVWHKITSKYLSEHSPILVGLVAVRTDAGIEKVAEKLGKAIENERNKAANIMKSSLPHMSIKVFKIQNTKMDIFQGQFEGKRM